MKWLSAIFAKDSVVEKAADGIYNGLDAMWHTSEEKEQDSKERIELFKDLIALTQNASPARRFIAIIVMSVWAFIAIDIVILINLSIIFDLDINDGLTLLIAFVKDYVAIPVTTVLGFYFLTHVVKPFARKTS